MSAKYLAKFRVAMSLAGVKVQASADLIGKSFVIVLQDLGVPANLLFTFEIINQRLSHYFIAFGSRSTALYSTPENFRINAHMVSYALTPSSSVKPFSRSISYAAKPEKMFRYEINLPLSLPISAYRRTVAPMHTTLLHLVSLNLLLFYHDWVYCCNHYCL